MFFDRHTDPEKIALIYGGRQLRYGELRSEIRKRAAWLQHHRAAYLLCHPSPVENLVNFLALMYTGQRGVFAGKHISAEEKLAYSQKHQLAVLDFIPADACACGSPSPAQATDVFLGILHRGEIIWKDYRSWFSAFEAQSAVFAVQGNDRVMVADALAYSANLNTVIHTLWLGGTVALTPLADAPAWPRLLGAATAVFLVPSHYRLLPDHLVFPQVTSAVSAGEKLDPPLAQKLLRIFPNACLTEYYGTPELGHISYIQNEDIISRPTSVGKPFPGVSIRIREEKIWVDSPYVSPDYRQRPTVSDLGFIDPDGQLCVFGRAGLIFHRRPLNALAEEIGGWEEMKMARVPATAPALLWMRAEIPAQDTLHQYYLEMGAALSQPPVLQLSLRSTGKINFKILRKKPVDEDPTLRYCA